MRRTSGARGKMRLASIDIGTNSTRLLVARTEGTKTETIVRRMEITRLGEGVDKRGFLSSEAIDRTLKVLEEYRECADEFSATKIFAAATSALRDAENGGEFLLAAEKVLGTRPRVLSGEEEAELSFTGAMSDIGNARGRVLVFDIGGGSTELVVGDAKGGKEGFTQVSSRSVNVGCVRMSERFLATDPPSPVSIGRMESHIYLALKPALDLLASEGVSMGVGLAGTVTTLSGMVLGLEEYNSEKIHHSKLKRSEVRELFMELAKVGLEERKKIMRFEPKRADVIIGGAAVLGVLMDIARLDEILVSEKDILDGMILDGYGKYSAQRT